MSEENEDDKVEIEFINIDGTQLELFAEDDKSAHYYLTTDVGVLIAKDKIFGNNIQLPSDVEVEVASFDGSFKRSLTPEVMCTTYKLMYAKKIGHSEDLLPNQEEQVDHPQ